jgi:hypothetical protein
MKKTADTHTQNMQYLILLLGNKVYATARQFYACTVRTVNIFKISIVADMTLWNGIVADVPEENVPYNSCK